MAKKIGIFIFFFLLTFISACLFYNFNKNAEPIQIKSGQITVNFPEASPVASPLPSPSPSPTPKPVAVRTKSLTLALLGDSMFQTMGEAAPLKNILEEDLPEYNVKILNFGIGSTSIETAPGRVSGVVAQNPDIVALDSFGYNHSAITLDQEWQILAQVVDDFKAKNIKVILVANIAPNGNIYAKGVEGLNWTDSQRHDEAEKTKAFIKNIINFAGSTKLPLADAYSESLGPDGEGKTMYIESTSNIHPTPEGHLLVYQKIAQAVVAILKK